MDDLDHSMCIADHDWKNFYEETEECWLLQPLLACSDDWSLSDSEDSGNLSVSLGTGRLELCRNPAATSDGGESNTVGCCTEDGEISQSRSGGEQDELTAKAGGESGRQAKPATCCDINAPCAEALYTRAVEHVLQVTSVPGTSRTTQQNALSPDGEATELKKGDGDTQKEANTLSLEEPDPLSANQRELSAGRDVSGVASRAEKERWFVTVSDGPPRQRARTRAEKTKTRQKKTCRKENKPRSSLKKKLPGSCREAQSNEISAGRPGSGGGAVAGLNLEMTAASGNMLTTDVDRQDPSGPSSSTGPSGLDSETGDSLEFVLAHSWDSDSYLSAEEETQEAQHLPSSPPLRKNSNCDSMVYHGHNTVPQNCESTDAALALPSAAQSADKTPNECSERDAGEGCVPVETPGPQAHGSVHPPASVSLMGDECGLPNVPDVTLTPCTVADNPETYAAAAGHHRPVYAISAFWDEMEKLTINDILQLRMGRGSPPVGADKTATPHVDDLAASHGSAADPAELSLPDASLMDGSDTADSDYFTQADDSKPDRSSCEFSASDFEEEYWQFLGTSRNPSPDPQPGKVRNYPFTGHEEEESTESEGRDTPVPPDSSADGSFEHQEAFTPDNPPDPRPILKSKSVRNIQALNTLDLRLDSKDEGSSFLCSCLSLEGEKLEGADDGLETQISLPFPPDTVAGNDWTQISSLEVPECCYTKENAGTNSRSVIVYNPEDISPVSALDHSFLYTLCCSHVSKEKPVPIFSYSHSTIRELTFPNYIFLSTDPMGDTIFPFTDAGDTLDTVRGLSSEAPEWFPTWNGLLPMRKIHFHDKGSIWWKGSGARFFPVEDRTFCSDKADLPIPRTDLESVSATGPQTRGDLAVQQRISDTIKIRQDYLFSKVRQSDMCLVCIAFASWVLRSSDPDAADAWKAALLANVSALSAIQYLRQYVRRKPSQNNP